MSTNWGKLKSWPSWSLRNSSKLPGEKNPENQQQHLPPLIGQPCLPRLCPYPEPVSYSLVPCSQPSHLDLPPGRILPATSALHTSRPGPLPQTPCPCPHLFSPYMPAPSAQPEPLNLCPRPFLIPDPAFTCPSPNHQLITTTWGSALRPHLVNPGPDPTPSTHVVSLLCSFTRVLPILLPPITDRHPSPSPRDALTSSQILPP